jgi:hypothetical protein
MSKKKKPAYGVGQVVQGEILPTIVIDWSDCIADPAAEGWTCGPVLPVGGEKPLAGKKGRAAVGPIKRTRGK